MDKLMLLIITSFIILTDANAEVTAKERDNSFFFSNGVVSNTSAPSTLQYFSFMENIPDEIAIDVFNNRDFSNLEGKKIFIGYGVVDPEGEDCKIFTPEVTGQDNNITVCLPWWRIERQYAITEEAGSGNDFKSFLSRMQRPRPPKNVTVCDEWSPSQPLPGGTVTCVSYYDRTLSDSCFNDPKKPGCYVNNCGDYVKKNCTSIGHSKAWEKTSIDSVHNASTGPKKYESKVDFTTNQYICPGGSFTNYGGCLDEKVVTMHPYECKADDPSTPLDDSIMKYCNESSPIRDVSSGQITGFNGECPPEASNSGVAFSVVCKVDTFNTTRNTCTEYGPPNIILKNEIVEEKLELDYTEQTVQVLSGAVDRFAAREDCVRANTIEDSRIESVYMKATGSGKLDDDIYLISHHADDTHEVQYCNQQHNRNAGSKLNFPELGGVVQCLPNSGTYSFEKKVNILDGDIISIQQATEAEDTGATSFSARTHYASSSVTIDNVEVTPEAYGPNTLLPNWENTLGTLTLMFPYSGAYTLYFYTDGGNLVASKKLKNSDFYTLGEEGYKQLFLADSAEIAPTLDDTNTSSLCLYDDWTEYGGGVWNKSGCQAPSAGNSYQKAHAIKRVIVKDELSGNFTVVPLVYPLGYINRVFIAKLKLYEDRVYHCYDQASIKAPF